MRVCWCLYFLFSQSMQMSTSLFVASKAYSDPDRAPSRSSNITLPAQAKTIKRSFKRSWNMKKVTLIVRQTEINKIFHNGLQLLLESDSSILDAIKAADKEIKKECGNFPVKGFESLLQMVYHPYEDRFYKQVAVQASSKSKPFLNIRENPKTPLPNETTIILIPQGGCQTIGKSQSNKNKKGEVAIVFCTPCRFLLRAEQPLSRCFVQPQPSEHYYAQSAWTLRFVQNL